MKRYINDWRMSYREHNNIKCSAPCTMYGVLSENGLIDDPYYGTNEIELTSYSDFPCEFASTISVSEDEYNNERIELVFYGLDTIADIYLNDILIGSTKNMHMAYTFDVKEYLNVGENTVRVYFSSPTEYFKYMNSRRKLWISAESIPGAPHLRKGLSMSGWDWGPQLPDMGIYRPVEIVFAGKEKINEFYISQKHCDNSVELDVELDAEGEYDYAVFTIDGKEYKLNGGKVKVNIENPKLWWPRGYGEQNLYDVKFELIKNGVAVDCKTAKIGLRTIWISQDSDKDGREFCFVVNGYKIFAMGANYIPEDSILQRVDKNRIKQILDACVDANYNCIRVWGGGYYPDDCFYELCDEYGIVVWQDFMVAGADVWLLEEFEQLFKSEAIYNVKRLRHHASLGLLCGNNEMEWFVTDSQDAVIRADYLKLYEHILPDVCMKYAPNVFYWPSSPSSGGGFRNAPNADEGDVHFWDVWHSSAPFTDYRKHRFRFCSEFGFESFPSIKTIKAFCPPEAMNPFSEIMESHQKCRGGNTKILTYLADTYLYATDFEKLIYASQLIQADAIRYGVEYFRRIRGCCMGSLYWQIHDCWPVASWSSIDYFGRYKALHYAAKKFYSPVLMSLNDEVGEVTINISNETMNTASGKIKYGVYDNDFNELMMGECDYETDKLSAKDIITVDTSEFINRHDVFFVAKMIGNDGSRMTQTALFTKPKHYAWKKPNISVSATKQGDKVAFSVSSDCYARGVEIDFENIDLVLSDNYFDIVDGEPITVTAVTDVSTDVLLKELKLKSTYDIR